MRRKLRIVTAVVLGMGVWALSLLAQQITVGPNIQVSKARENDAHYEVLLAADPNNPSNLLGGAMVWSTEKNNYALAAYASFDGGQTWTLTLEVGESITADPAVAYGPDGTAYYALIGRTPDYKKGRELFYRSKDGGRTWLPPIELPVFDRPYIVVDDTEGKYHGHVYIHGAGGVRTIDGKRPRVSSVTIFRSVDGGATFEAPVKLASAENHYVLGMGNGVVLSDGTLVILSGELQQYNWGGSGSGVAEAKPDKPNSKLKVVTSEDGGEAFSKASIVNDYYMPWGPAYNSTPYLAVDRSKGPFKDRLCAVWPDARSGRIEILSAYSSDKGKTWSKPVVVNDDRPPLDLSKGPDHFMPVVAVNSEGVVGVMWYDRQDSPNNLDWGVRFAASLDGGETFFPSVKVSEAPFTHGKDDLWPIRARARGGGSPQPWLRGGPLKLELSVNSFNFNGGHTAGLAADAKGVFHPFWVDNRTGISQIWTAPVTVKGKAMLNGSPELANLEDITEEAYIKFTNTHYDRATNTVSVDAQLENTSEQTLIGPIKVRVISLKSDIGIPIILTTDNGKDGVGAVWDFTLLLKDSRLKPKQKSAVKRLEFAVSNMRPLRPRKGGAVALVRIEGKLLGKAEKPEATEKQPE